MIGLRAAVLLSVLVPFVIAVPLRPLYRFAPGASALTKRLDASSLCENIGRVSGCSGCEATNGLCHWYYSYDSSYGGVDINCLSLDDLEGFEPGELFVASSSCPANPGKEVAYTNMKYPFKSGSGSWSRGVSSQWFSSWHDTDLANFPQEPWPVDRTSSFGVAGYNPLLQGPDWAFNDPTKAGITCEALTSAELFNPNHILEGFVANDRDRYCVKKFLDLYLVTACPAYGVPVSGMCASLAEELEVNCAPCKTNVRLRVYTFNPSLPKTIPFRDDLYFVSDDTPHCLKELPDIATPRLLALAGLTSPTSTPTFRTYTPYIGAPVCN